MDKVVTADERVYSSTGVGRVGKYKGATAWEGGVLIYSATWTLKQLGRHPPDLAAIL
jgi:hypothetical protein